MINVVYEDNHIIVVIKPYNVLTQSDVTNDKNMLDMVRDYIKVKYNKPGNVYVGMVQRLDRPVGGLLVFAKTSKAAARLSEDIRKDNIVRVYTADVHGKTKVQDVLINYLVKDKRTNMVKAYSNEVKGSKYAKLEYKNIEYKEGISRVEITLHTGRAHQIRVQMSGAGYPIYGDMRYGKGEKGHIHLFCSKLEILHPTKKEWMTFEAQPDF